MGLCEGALMGAFPTIAAGYDWSLASNLNMFVTAARNRNYMITNGNYGAISTVSAGADVSAASWIRALQSWVEGNYQYFCRMKVSDPNQPGTAYGNDTHAGLKYNATECGSVAAAATNFSTDAGLRVSSTPSSWWRRYAPGFTGGGPMTAGDYIGYWVWEDLARAFKALRLYRMTSTVEFFPVKLAWLEVQKDSYPPNPPGLMDLAYGQSNNQQSSPYTINYATPRSSSVSQYRNALMGNSYSSGLPDFKVGNYAYERFDYYPPNSAKWRYYAQIMGMTTELHWTTTARWPTGTGSVIAFIRAELTVAAGRQQWPPGYSPHYYENPIYEFEGGPYFRKPPTSRGGYAPITSIVSGWNSCYRRAMTNLNTLAIAHEANVVDPVEASFNAWTAYSMDSFTWLGGNSSIEVVSGWSADTAEAYYLVDEY
jgi:hypothetical protein